MTALRRLRDTAIAGCPAATAALVRAHLRETRGLHLNLSHKPTADEAARAIAWAEDVIREDME